jgi:hypothetical protein
MDTITNPSEELINAFLDTNTIECIPSETPTQTLSRIIRYLIANSESVDVTSLTEQDESQQLFISDRLNGIHIAINTASDAIAEEISGGKVNMLIASPLALCLFATMSSLEYKGFIRGPVNPLEPLSLDGRINDEISVYSLIDNSLSEGFIVGYQADDVSLNDPKHYRYVRYGVLEFI